MSILQDKIFKLKGKVQHYAWGGYDFIPRWLGIENTEHKPFAEYWMGAHPSSSSEIITQKGNLSLYHLIKDYGPEFIGESVFSQFGELPFLFKILDVRDMLSIQVHPTREEAILGFETEETAGISINASTRNYKDRNHKPEVMAALSEFWLLHGFKQENELKKTLDAVPEFKYLKAIFENEGYKGLYQHVMSIPQGRVNELLISLVERELKLKSANELTKEDPGWWVTKLFEGKNDIKEIDRGVFSIYFFNIVKALPGEAIFQGAGVPHAYLEGQNAELMANSDNVLRGGLTTKHIDVPELMKHIHFEGITPDIMKRNNTGQNIQNYPCPVPDFGMQRIEMNGGDALQFAAASMEIIVVIYGELVFTGTNRIIIKKGETAAILAGESYSIHANTNTLAYKAFIP